MIRPLLKGTGRLTLALDDTPTKRYGPHVQGPQPHGSPYVYGHVFVVLALLVAHPTWGVVALPLLARLYFRKKDLPGIDPKHWPAFRTKLELAVELFWRARPWLGLLDLPIWVVADGAYASREFLGPAKTLGMTVVSRGRDPGRLGGRADGVARLLLHRRFGEPGGHLSVGLAVGQGVAPPEPRGQEEGLAA